ncbi:hypothetical protein AB0C02_28220 [Micromonospora sp. NPDC048999]|uniref:hypothetical protein n=1 Tax=Micromonospora sp. NPDC048999 TaxID=3155391 RepID=UPI0034036E78
MNTTTTTLQIITDVEATNDGYTRGWIVPASTPADADLEIEAVDHIDIPTTDDEADWMQGLRDELAAAGYAIEGTITRDGATITATVVQA